MTMSLRRPWVSTRRTTLELVVGAQQRMEKALVGFGHLQRRYGLGLELELGNGGSLYQSWKKLSALRFIMGEYLQSYNTIYVRYNTAAIPGSDMPLPPPHTIPRGLLLSLCPSVHTSSCDSSIIHPILLPSPQPRLINRLRRLPNRTPRLIQIPPLLVFLPCILQPPLMVYPRL